MSRRFARTIGIITLILVLILSACDISGLLPGGKDTDGSSPDVSYGLSDETPQAFRDHEDIISTAIGDELAFVAYNKNVPSFSEEDWNGGEYYISLSELDELDRVGVVIGLFDAAHMPTDDRESIGSVTPTGWNGNNNKYDFVSAGYIYNRCHLLGFQISGLNAEKRNLMTGTRFFNIEANLTYEDIIADHLAEYDGSDGDVMHQVLIRVTPDFYGENLVAHGEVYEADCMQCDDIDFAVYMLNKQPGVTIDYRSGANWANSDNPPVVEDVITEDEATYILNARSKKIHNVGSTCMSPESSNYVLTDLPFDELVAEGYSACGTCKPTADSAHVTPVAPAA